MSYVKLGLAAVLAIGFAARSDASLITFDSNNGGFTASTIVMNSGGTGTPWTYTTGSDCWGGVGCWLIVDYGNISEQALTTPIYSATGSVVFAFDETFNEESSGATAYDGGVVEIAVNGGAFQDIVTAYGAFTGQTYNKTISTGWSNPLGGRAAFSGVNPGGFGTFVQASMTLPLTNGDHFQIRWVQGTDSASVASIPNGWILDNVNLTFNGSVSANPEPRETALVALAIAGCALVRRKRRTA